MSDPTRRRRVVLLVVCVLIGAGLLAAPVRSAVQEFGTRGRAADVGASPADAACRAPSAHEITGPRSHVPTGTRVRYAQIPPAFGAHWDTPAPFTKRFYTAADRPAVETLVHNLEHGYTIAWYRADAPAGQIADLEAVADTFTAAGFDPRQKFIAAPWSDRDGAGFPADVVVVLARWTADPYDTGDPGRQRGVEQACARVSGAAIQRFMEAYPSTGSPEPLGP